MYISGEFKHFGFVWFMVFNATFNNISVISWLLMVPQGRHVYDRMEVGFTTTCAISTKSGIKHHKPNKTKMFKFTRNVHIEIILRKRNISSSVCN
jgi:hypothetical protein